MARTESIITDRRGVEASGVDLTFARNRAASLECEGGIPNAAEAISPCNSNIRNAPAEKDANDRMGRKRDGIKLNHPDALCFVYA